MVPSGRLEGTHFRGGRQTPESAPESRKGVPEGGLAQLQMVLMPRFLGSNLTTESVHIASRSGLEMRWLEWRDIHRKKVLGESLLRHQDPTSERKASEFFGVSAFCARLSS